MRLILFISSFLMLVPGDSLLRSEGTAAGVAGPAPPFPGAYPSPGDGNPPPAVSSSIMAQAARAAAPKTLPPYPTPPEIIAEIEADAQAHPPDVLTRWIAIRSGQAEDFKALSDALNKVSRGATIRRPIPVGKHVARINLQWYAPREQDLEDWLVAWEKLEFDPTFSTLITQDTLKLLDKTVIAFDRVEWFRKEDRWQRRMAHREKQAADILVVRTNTPILQGTSYARLQEVVISQAAVVSIEYLIPRLLGSIQDKDGKKDTVFSAIWGGLYYDFAGIRSGVKGSTSDLDQLLADLGIGDGKTPFQQIFDKLRSDERAAMFRSNVTGKPRRILWIATPASRLSTASGVIFITEDIRDRDIDTSQHAILSLITLKVAAYEVIWTRANGSQGYGLFGANGERADEAPPDVVADRTVPTPHTTRLQIFSCIRCHGPHDGWQPFTNDVKTILTRSKVDNFGDVSDQEINKPISDTVDRIAGWYAGDGAIPLARAREDYDRYVLKATGPWKGAGAQVHVVKLSSERLSQLYAQDRWDMVDAREALRRLGYASPLENAAATVELQKILPPDPRARFGDIIAEDPRIAGLLAGLSITPVDWAFIESFAQERAHRGQR